ncbi:MAG: hypothetical protein ACXACH_08325, partial [Candidatus Hermodarchaeia archaeon]
VMKYMDLLESDKNLERLVKRIEQLQRQVDKERILGKRKGEKDEARSKGLGRLLYWLRGFPSV